MNQFNFVGRLIADPDIRYAQNDKQTCIANFQIAVERDFKKRNEPTADFFRVTAFGLIAERIERFCTKGTKLICTATVQNDTYEKDGVKHYGFKFLLQRFEFAESRKFASENGAEDTEETPSSSPADDSDGFMPIPQNLDIDMPFA